jgi:hypothetical protein
LPRIIILIGIHFDTPFLRKKIRLRFSIWKENKIGLVCRAIKQRKGSGRVKWVLESKPRFLHTLP